MSNYGPVYRYAGLVRRVVDADTVDVTVDLGFNVYHDIRVRLKDIDAPELRARTVAERQHAQQAKSFVESLLPVGTPIVMDSFQVGVYNRWDAYIYYQDSSGSWFSLSEVLLAAGFSKRESYDTEVVTGS